MTRWLTLLLLATSSMAQSPLPHFSIENPEATLKDAFVEQRRLVKQEIKQIGGFKGGAVSANAKKWFKSDKPMSGVLPEHGWIRAGKPLSIAHKDNRVLEVEIGFIIGRDVTRPLADAEEARSIISEVVPAVEMPLNRVGKKGEMLFRDFIAANVGADQYLVGKPFEKGIDVDGIKISLSRDGVELTTAVGSTADGGQWDNVVFQVNKALEQGYEVEKGQIIMTGSLGKIVPAELGDYVARYDGHSDISFSITEQCAFSATEVFKGGRVNSVQAHDYDGDGLKDLIYVADKKLFLAFGPRYEKLPVFAFPDKFRGDSLHNQLMDVDGDGDMDFVGCSFGLYWIECPDKPKSQWRFHKISSESNGIHCILIHDVDADGAKDVVINNYLPQEKFGESIIWYRVPENPRTDKWKPLPLADRTAPGGVHYMSMGDLDGDGVEEFLAGAKGQNFKNGNWFAYWKRGQEVEKPWKRTTIPGQYLGATHVYPADVDKDGRMDLVGSMGHGKGIVWLKGPNFEVRPIDDKLIGPHAMQIADLDDDGDVDVVACANFSAKAQWFENDGKGNFARRHLLNDQRSYDLTISDLNGDGRKDIVIAGWKDGNVMILLRN